ncbi:MAG: ABC transporter ATP-binding protein [Prevotella sp.]|nr:ABC transporter ATP-binding protein [Prevotella sp.]
MDKNIAIEFQGVGKQYRLGRVSTGTLQHDLNRFWQTKILGHEDPYLKIGEVNDRSTKGHSDYVWALKDINFKVEQGDVVGIIGKNGAGKSTLLKLLSHITAPSTGDIFYRGRIASLLEVGTGFHGELTGKENIYMNGAVLGMTKHEIKKKLDDIIEFAGVERYIDTPVKRYSSGMTVRLGFAVAAFLEPEILVVDEVLTVGDAEFQKRAIGKMDDVAKNGGRTVLFVSHNMTSVKQLCNSGILLEDGQIKYIGSSEKTIEEYMSVDIKETDKPLSIREDRTGNGKLRFSQVVFKNINNTPISECFVNQTLKIEIHIDIVDPKYDKDKLILACVFCDGFGVPITSWISDEIEHQFNNLGKENTITLTIPNLYLRPQTYNLKLQISEGSTNPKDFCDAIYNAATITVVNDDVFTSGVNLKECRGYQAVMPAVYD